MMYNPTNLIYQPGHCPLCHSPHAAEAGAAGDAMQALEIRQACISAFTSECDLGQFTEPLCALTFSSLCLA